MLMVTILEQTGWTYEQYQDTPAYVLELIREKMVRDNKERELQSRKLRHG